MHNDSPAYQSCHGTVSNVCLLVTLQHLQQLLASTPATTVNCFECIITVDYTVCVADPPHCAFNRIKRKSSCIIQSSTHEHHIKKWQAEKRNQMRLVHGCKDEGQQLAMEAGRVIDSCLVIGRRASSCFYAHSLLIHESIGCHCAQIKLSDLIKDNCSLTKLEPYHTSRGWNEYFNYKVITLSKIS